MRSSASSSASKQTQGQHRICETFFLKTQIKQNSLVIYKLLKAQFLYLMEDSNIVSNNEFVKNYNMDMHIMS